MSGEAENRRIYGRRFRTELCKSYMTTGHCKYHNRCMFAHGMDLLRTEDQNNVDGLNCESAIRAWAKTHRPLGHMGVTPVSPLQASQSPLSSHDVHGHAFATVSRPMSDSIGGMSDHDIESPPPGLAHPLDAYALHDNGRWWRHDPYSLDSPVVESNSPNPRRRSSW